MIQHAGIYVSGFIQYDINKINTSGFGDTFEDDTYYTDNKNYFQQKYYSNWLHTLYPDKQKLHNIGLAPLTSSHLIIKLPSDGWYQVSTTTKKIDFSIVKCRLFLFQEGLAVFSIKLLLTEENVNFEDISSFTNIVRNTTTNSKSDNNPLIAFIEKNIAAYIEKDNTNWLHFNPHLKLFLNIDVTEAMNEEKLNHLLFELASVSPVGTMSAGGLYAPSAAYYNELMANNTIHVFNNWKVLCLFDSTVRISVNLKDIDSFNLWENDYYTIYVFTLFIRYYLYQTNARIASVAGNIKAAAVIRNNYIRFLNDFDLTQIAFKFLPDVIYRSLLRAMNIEAEMQKLEQKISRIDTSIRESQERNIEFLLRIVAVISLISVIDDAWDLAMKALGLDEALPHNYIVAFVLSTISILTIFIIIALFVVRRSQKLLR